MKEQIQQERAQLINHWKRLDVGRLERSAARVKARFAVGSPKRGDWVRQFHDVLGYMAKGEPIGGGLCAGCLYRTEPFVLTSQDSRTGVRVPPENLTRVHVEHTVPVSTLVDRLDALDVGGWQVSDLMVFLLKHSVVTAALAPEGRVRTTATPSAGIVKKGYASRSDVFDVSHPHAGLPFMRYCTEDPAIKVYDVLSGQPIPLGTFTIDHHVGRIKELLKTVGSTIQL